MTNDKRLIIWSIIGTGITSLTVQLLTIREFLSQFNGNEITISLFLFVWLILSGMGSLLSKLCKHASTTLYSLLILIIALWPLPQLILIRILREVIFIHGTSPGFYHIFLYITVTTAPYCLLTGFILPYSQKVLRANHHEFSSGELYITDNIGDILGGVLFSFILVYWLKPFKTIALTSSLLIIVTIFLQKEIGRNILLFLSILASAIFYYYGLNYDFEESTLINQYGNIKYYLESPFGRIIITKEGSQYTFWESGMPIYSDSNMIKSEEKIHYPLSQLDSIRNILLISGGLGMTLDEALKYSPERIDYVEMDPSVTDIAQELGLIKRRPNLRIINRDARSYVKETKIKYDAIIVDFPDPDTFQLNRFFTREFFLFAKESLTKNGVFSFSMSYSSNIISEIRRKKLSTAFNTALTCFENVKILPGGDAYFICRDGEISMDIPARLNLNGIPTVYIEGYYYGNVTEERIKEINQGLDREEFINTDFEPRMMNIFFKEWFEKHGNTPRPFIVILLIIIVIYLLTLRREEFVLFSTGVSAMGAEMLIIFSFQVIYGYVYLKIGAIVSVFLIGLLPGAAVGNLFKDKNRNRLILSEIILLCLLLSFYVWIGIIKTELHQLFFLGYCFAFSFVCGFQFPVITILIGEKQSPAAGCIAADLAGAAIGTLVVGTLLIPFWGVQSAIFFLLSMKLLSSMIIMFQGKREY